MKRRSLLGAVGTGVSIGITGCIGFGPATETAEQETQLRLTDSELSASTLQSTVDDIRERYGRVGVWGTTETEPNHELGFQAAWTDTLTHEAGGRSDHLIAFYRLPPGPDGQAAAQVWLWSGFDPEAAGTVRRIETGISLPTETGSLGIYSPAQDISASDVSEYAIESGRLDTATIGATMPLSSGRIGVDEATQIGSGGAYYPFWTGEIDTIQSLIGTTEIRWPAGTDRRVDWSVTMETMA